jgi:hypothetical protein
VGAPGTAACIGLTWTNPAPSARPGPGRQLGEVPEVAHAPGAPGQQRVDLHEQPVRTPRCGGQPRRRDDEMGAGGPPVGGGGLQLVDAERQLLGGGPRLALLGTDPQPGPGGQRGEGGGERGVSREAGRSGGRGGRDGLVRRTAARARPARCTSSSAPGADSRAPGPWSLPAAVGAPLQHTSVGGSSRSPSSVSRAVSAVRTASGVAAATPSAARTATTAASEAATVRPGTG